MQSQKRSTETRGHYINGHGFGGHVLTPVHLTYAAMTCSVFGADFDCIDPVRVKREVFLDCGHGGVRSLVGPDRINRTFPARGNAVIGAFPLVGTIRGMLLPFKLNM